MMRKRNTIMVSVAALAAVAGAGTGVGLAAGGSPGRPAAPAGSVVASVPGSADSAEPGWMRGGALPSPMMGTGTDPGTAMGHLFANAPGPRVSPVQASAMGRRGPSGASIDRTARTITFTTMAVRLVALASPSMPDESFRIAGMTDPAISVPSGAHVTIELVNADDDMAHGLVIMPAAAGSAMPMMTSAPSFAGSALWFLGSPTAAGMHAGTLHFTATAPGTYRYLCPVPGHARDGMAGAFIVRS